MKTIYAVNAGSYSDYRVVALFSTQEKAEAFMRAIPRSDYNSIDEYELDPNQADLVERGYCMWDIEMRLNGDVESAGKAEYIGCGEASHSVWHKPGHVARLLSKVWAKSEKAAIKIANEHRIQMVARGEIKA